MVFLRISLQTLAALLMSLSVTIGAQAAETSASPTGEKSASHSLTIEQRKELFPNKIQIGAQVRVKSYDARKKIFNVQITTESAVGPLTTTLEFLKRAMGQPTAARGMDRPQDWVGREFTLVEELQLLPDSEAPAQESVPKTKKRR